MSERAPKDRITIWHQWVTLVLAPLSVLAISWLAVSFFEMKADIQAIKLVYFEKFSNMTDRFTLLKENQEKLERRIDTLRGN